jgi:hypothetical protein
MQQTTIKQAPRGEYVKRKPEAKAVYIRGEYCRESKAFELIDADDINRVIYLKADKPVFIGFTY